MELKEIIESKLKKRISPHLLLNRMRFSDDNIKNSFYYNEPTYIPFYYWLGTILKPKTLLEIGFKVGLVTSVFLKSCKTVVSFLAVQEPKGVYYSPRLGISNVRDHYRKKLEIYTGNVEDEFLVSKMKCLNLDLAIINEETSYDRYIGYFELVWGQLAVDGYMVVDCLSRYKSLAAAVKDFCISKNVEATYINTTYKVSIIRKV